jgi:hypothetical protein
VRYVGQESGYIVAAVLALAPSANSPLFAGLPPTENFYLNSVGSGLNYADVHDTWLAGDPTFLSAASSARAAGIHHCQSGS